MNVQQLTSEKELQQYDKWVKSHPQGNLWQSVAYKKYIEARGKEVRIYALLENEQIRASAQVSIDRTNFGLATWDISRGPLWKLRAMSCERSAQLLKRIVDDAKRDHCFAFYLSPIKKLGTWNLELGTSPRYIHAQATIKIDLTASEEEILAQMKPKGRYNIKVAQKHDVTVRQSEDIDAFYDLAKETSGRDNFTLHPKSHYEAFLKYLPHSFLLLALDKEQKPISGLLGVLWNEQAIYYYGASSYAHRASMAPYLLQWEAMRLCKTKGCTSYDLLGIAPSKAVSCELRATSSSKLSHPWQGISAFKEKFGGAVVTYPPEQMIVLRPWTKQLLEIKRKIFG